MHYYQKNIPTWVQHTAHLSLEEEAIYSRLIEHYYDTERPIPKDTKKVFKKLRMLDKADLAQSILEEFFTLENDGCWHSKRCDEIIKTFQDGQEGAEARRENERERQRKSRQRRKQLFEMLNKLGIVMPFNTPTTELVTRLSRVTGVTVTMIDTAITNNQEPITNNQEPIFNTLSGGGPRESFEWSNQSDWLKEHCPSLTLDDVVVEADKWVNADKLEDVSLVASFRHWMLNAELYQSKKRAKRMRGHEKNS